MDLKQINGREILDFLNAKQKNNELDEVSLNGFHFEEQGIRDEKYILDFMTYFNNWGTFQEMYGNSITITKKGKVYVSVDEPFEGDGSENKIKEVLEEWLKIHVFKDNFEEEFKKLIEEGKTKLSEVESFQDKSKINEVIEILKNSLTYVK